MAVEMGFIESTRGQSSSLVSVVNWQSYQASDDEHEPTSEPSSEPSSEPTSEPTSEPQTIKKERNKEIKKETKRAPARPLTEEDGLSEKSVQYALANGMPDAEIDDEFLKFRDYHMKHDNRYRNWTAAWQTWVRNWKKFRDAKRPNSFVPTGELPGLKEVL